MELSAQIDEEDLRLSDVISGYEVSWHGMAGEEHCHHFSKKLLPQPKSLSE